MFPENELKDGVPSGALFHQNMLVPMDYRWNNVAITEGWFFFVHKVQDFFVNEIFWPVVKDHRLYFGRLSAVVEGAGKRRVFAIGNYVRQSLLRPVHDWAMNVLKRIPMDGTFDQEKPIRALRKLRCRDVYSFDLKSATDRFPLRFIYQVLHLYFGPRVASCIAHGALGLSSYEVSGLLKKKRTNHPRLVSFVVGQPLGYLGSWPLFTLAHHMLVWLAALTVYPKEERFTRYALLGDDIVIADVKVASEYQWLIRQLGVDISLPKSLISNNGTLEFAKRFWTDELQVDLSPVSCKSLNSVSGILSLLQFADRYSITKLSVLARLRGFGYRVLGKLNSTSIPKLERLKAASLKPVREELLPLEWWIGRGKPLNPYLRGIIVALVLKELAPRQLELVPEERLGDDDKELLERMHYRNWVQDWLRWLHWYSEVISDPAPSLKKLFSAPVVNIHWKKDQIVKEEIKRFGLLYKLYDLGHGKWTSDLIKSFTPPCLTEGGDRYTVSSYGSGKFQLTCQRDDLHKNLSVSERKDLLENPSF